MWWLQKCWGWAALGIVPFPGPFPLLRTGDPTGKNLGTKHVRAMKRSAQAARRGHTVVFTVPIHTTTALLSGTKRLGSGPSAEQNNLFFLISELSRSTGSLPRLGYGCPPTTSLLQDVGHRDIPPYARQELQLGSAGSELLWPKGEGI